MMYNPIIDLIVELWERWWGNDDDRKKPIKFSRVMTAANITLVGIVLACFFMQAAVYVIVVFDVPYKFAGVLLFGSPFLVAVIAYLFDFVMYRKYKPEQRCIPLRRWLSGAGLWWQFPPDIDNAKNDEKDKK